MLSSILRRFAPEDSGSLPFGAGTDQEAIPLARRDFLRLASGSAAALALSPRAEAAFNAPLAFQLFGVRAAAVKDLPGTMRRVAALGYREVEMISFPGYAANTPRDGFGPLADMKPDQIRATIRSADLRVQACHFKLHELEGDALATSLDWARGVGIREIVISDITPSQTRADWEQNFARVAFAGNAVAKAGLSMCLHTPSDVWRVFDDGRVFDLLLQRMPAARLQVQLDLSSTLSMGVDPAQVLTSFGKRITSLHLRDGRTPKTQGDYVDALPLGQGDIRWQPLLAAARRAGVKRYVVEMVSRDPAVDPFEALRNSADYLRSL
jgi:sugar phosphate isomerase/epimerase